MGRMDLRQLEIVQAVAETGSFTGAGRKLHVSQSAISRQILLLEDELNESLFLRIGRRVRITAAGESFVLFEAASNSRRIVDAFVIKERIEPRIVMETENVEILKALVRAEMGITIIPYQAVAREVRGRQLFCARVSGAQLVRHTGWVYQRSNRVPRGVEEMFRAYQRILPKLNLRPAGRHDAGNQ